MSYKTKSCHIDDNICCKLSKALVFFWTMLYWRNPVLCDLIKEIHICVTLSKKLTPYNQKLKHEQISSRDSKKQPPHILLVEFVVPAWSPSFNAIVIESWFMAHFGKCLRTQLFFVVLKLWAQSSFFKFQKPKHCQNSTTTQLNLT